MFSSSISFANRNKRISIPVIFEHVTNNYDVVIVFHSCRISPKSIVTRRPNPYFVAKIDNQISYKSALLFNTWSPNWIDEEWIVRNIPSNAKLSIDIYNENESKHVDNFIGKVEISDIINCQSSTVEHEIIDSSRIRIGTFHLTINSSKSVISDQQLARYTFDGPCRYFRYDFLSTDSVNSIWKIQLRRISNFFPVEKRCQWNRKHQPAHDLFDTYSDPSTSQRTIKLNESGRLTNADDLWKFIFVDRETQTIKPRLYNYIIDENSWQFSEIAFPFFNDSSSKHILLASCSDNICFAGELHLRPKFGWTRMNNEWELVFDNASGTYSPDADLLVNLQELLCFNFPGLNLVTYSYKDPMLRESIEQLELAAQKYKYITGRTETSFRLIDN